MKPIRVVFDTNLWISYLIARRFSKLDEFIVSGKLTLLFSAELLEEFVEVIGRPKFRGLFTKKDVEELLDLFDVYGKLVKVRSSVTICRDLKDNFILALAKDGKAHFVITGDDDLLSIGKFGSTRILKYRDFLLSL